MSGGITTHDRPSALYAGITVDAAEESFARAEKVLAGIRGGAKRAIGSALARAAAAGKTSAKGAVTKEYAISQSDFLARTKNINHFVKTGYGEYSVVFGFRGHVIPLLHFNTKYSRGGKVVAQVKRANTAKELDRAFIAQINSHRGVFMRQGPERLPIVELFGPATPQMMYSNENVSDEIEEKMLETFDKRIDHEITRILNGWGGSK